MTAAQQKKLNTIIAKLETLQRDSEGATQKERDAMRVAKDRLLEILK